MNDEHPRLTPAEVMNAVNLCRKLAQRAHDHGDSVLWMVLHSAAESVADGLEMQQEMWADVE